MSKQCEVHHVNVNQTFEIVYEEFENIFGNWAEEDFCSDDENDSVDNNFEYRVQFKDLSFDLKGVGSSKSKTEFPKSTLTYVAGVNNDTVENKIFLMFHTISKFGFDRLNMIPKKFLSKPMEEIQVLEKISLLLRYEIIGIELNDLEVLYNSISDENLILYKRLNDTNFICNSIFRMYSRYWMGNETSALGYDVKVNKVEALSIDNLVLVNSLSIPVERIISDNHDDSFTQKAIKLTRVINAPFVTLMSRIIDNHIATGIYLDKRRQTLMFIEKNLLISRNMDSLDFIWKMLLLTYLLDKIHYSDSSMYIVSDISNYGELRIQVKRKTIYDSKISWLTRYKLIILKRNESDDVILKHLFKITVESLLDRLTKYIRDIEALETIK